MALLALCCSLCPRGVSKAQAVQIAGDSRVIHLVSMWNVSLGSVRTHIHPTPNIYANKYISWWLILQEDLPMIFSFSVDLKCEKLPMCSKMQKTMPYVWGPFNSSCDMYSTHGDLCHNSRFRVIIKTRNLCRLLIQEEYWQHEASTWSKADRGMREWDWFLLETKKIFFLLDHLQVMVSVYVGFAQFIKALATVSKNRPVRMTEPMKFMIMMCPSPLLSSHLHSRSQEWISWEGT